jgi:dTDP-4-amino-4,6-dideoxygalactose transaminase
VSFKTLFDFEEALARYTGAPYVIVTDGCTHALELCFRHDNIQETAFSAFTYLSVPMLMHHLGVKFTLTDEIWNGEYQFHGTRIWDSARRLLPDMYRPGQFQCLSFGWTKPLQLGKVGAILLDDKKAYETILHQRYDGRDLTVAPWQDQKTFHVGYHYKPSIEDAIQGVALLQGVKEHNPKPVYVAYPDLREIEIVD